MKLAVIGGEGRMGRCLLPLFQKLSSELRTSSGDNLPLVEWADVVIISVPIRNTLEVIEEISPHMRSNQLLLDITSVKQKPCEAMLRSKASVIGMHPLFGPSVSNFRGQHLVLSPVRAGDWLTWLKGALSEEGFLLQEMTPEKHDRLMASVQGLVHFTVLSFTATLKREEIDLSEAQFCATPVFRMLIHLAGRILNQSAELYSDIEMENPFFQETLESLFASQKEFASSVKQQDRQAFEESFQMLSSWIGDEMKSKSQEITDAFIEILGERA